MVTADSISLSLSLPSHLLYLSSHQPSSLQRPLHLSPTHLLIYHPFRYRALNSSKVCPFTFFQMPLMMIQSLLLPDYQLRSQLLYALGLNISLPFLGQCFASNTWSKGKVRGKNFHSWTKEGTVDLFSFFGQFFGSLFPSVGVWVSCVCLCLDLIWVQF